MGNQKRPYVRYRFEASIQDKGMSFAIRRAADSFFSRHGIEHKFVNWDVHSDRVEAVLEVYDNKNPDFFSSALANHIAKSGRIPSDISYDINLRISPIPYSPLLEVGRDNKIDDIAWIKTTEQLQRDISTRDATISELNKSVDERQKVINHKHIEVRDTQQKVVSLERELEGSMKRRYASPLDAILEGYLSKSQELLLEVSEDWEKIVSDKNEDFFVSDESRDASSAYLNYVNLRCGMNFVNISSLDEWMKSLPVGNSWEETHRGSELSREIKKIEADLNLLRIAEESGASEGVVTALKQATGGVYHRKNNLEKEAKGFREEFEKNVSIRELLTGSRENYDRFREVVERSERRRKSGAILPLLIYDVSDESSTIYFCSINNESNLEIYLRSRMEKLLKSLPASLGESKEVGVQHIAGFSIVPESKTAYIPNKHFCDSLDEKNIFGSLGVKLSTFLFLDANR